jgi:hypothetical protein
MNHSLNTKPYTVLVCGGRDFGDFEGYKEHPHHPNYKKKYYEMRFIRDTLTVLRMDWPKEVLIIAGGAKGVDHVAIVWAEETNLDWKEYPANWNYLKNAAGPIRNKQMLVDGKPDLVVAFPGGPGTANMMKQARESKPPVPVKEITL